MESSISDQFAGISPVIIVGVVLLLTVFRVALSRVKDSWARLLSEICDTATFVLIFAFLLIRPFVAQAFYIPSQSMERTLLVNDRLIVDKFSYRLHQPHHGDVVVFNAPPAAETTDGIDYIKRMIGTPGDTIQIKAATLTIKGRAFDPDQYDLSDLHSYLRDRLGLTVDDSVKIYRDHLLVNGTTTIPLDKVATTLGFAAGQVALTPGTVYRNGVALNEPYTREDPDYNYPESGIPLQLGPDQFFMMGDNRNRSKDSHYWGTLERWRIVGKADVVFWPLPRMGVIR